MSDADRERLSLDVVTELRGSLTAERFEITAPV
jgi:hypothetical protein